MNSLFFSTIGVIHFLIYLVISELSLSETMKSKPDKTESSNVSVIIRFLDKISVFAHLE
jgi:hypothetical protein